ncbi:MAG: phosphate ABC transporter substrate-binding protein PstS [Burkholderiales bacterium]|jgi:phosphate transport system substrate-binding protein|nr:phosphate ABC transporter substrate-binding protein PstS [Burkholderiales bacterium]
MSLLGVLLGLPGAIHATEIKGAGATFPSAVYRTWAAGYEKEHGSKVSYLPTGSGDGVQRIVAREVDFGATDSPLSPADLAKYRLVQFPMAVGGIVPVVNLHGVGANQLKLTGDVLADIMRGAVTHWNDKRIAALNPELSLPASPIVRVVRAEKSGTTEAFSKYLSAVSPEWASGIGHGQLVKWTGHVLAVEGNDGIVKALKDTQGAISYVSYDRVISNKLAAVRVRNRAGQFAHASDEAFKSAVQESDLHKKGDETASLLDQDGSMSWPISVTTYVLVDAQPKTAAGARDALQFLYWTFLRGDSLIRSSGLTPLPTAVQARLVHRFLQVRPQDGQPLNFYSF